MSEKITPNLPPTPGSGIYIAKYTDLKELRAMSRRIGNNVIFYGANTCWWTCDPRDLYRKTFKMNVAGKEVENALPCDPRGGMLMEAHDPARFFQFAMSQPEVYGKHGIRELIAAYHGNIIVSETDKRPTCFATWEEYTVALDEYDARHPKLK